MTQQTPYVLGTGDDELQRLSLQHRLWADAAHAAFRRAGITIAQRVLDVGCGPGFAASGRELPKELVLFFKSGIFST